MSALWGCLACTVAALSAAAEPGARVPLRVPTFPPAGPRLEEARNPVDPTKLFAPQQFVAGPEFGLVTTPEGAFAVDARGVQGPLVAPGKQPIAAAMPVGKAGAILLVTPSGAGFLAPTLDAALRGEGLTERKAVPAVVAFDAAEDVVVIAQREAVHVSLDQGQQYTRVALPAGHVVEDVFARADGVVALVARARKARGSVVFVSNRGGPFTASAFQPHGLRRVGGLITSRFGCLAALTDDGVTWWAPSWGRSLECSPEGAPPGAPAAGDPFGLEAYETPRLHLTTADAGPRPPAKLPTATDPPTPRAAPEGQRATGPAPGHGLPHSLGLKGWGRGEGVLHGSDGPLCSGADCLRLAFPPTPVRGRHELWRITDARCAESDVEQGPSRRCKLGATPVTPASLAVVDHGARSVRAVRPSTDCPRRTILQSRSVMLVSCETDGTPLEQVFPDGRTQTLSANFGSTRLQLVDVSDDGTFVVSHPPVGLVAVGHPSGGQTAFRTLDGPLLWARPLRAGHALVARRTDQRLELGVDAPGRGFVALAPPIDLGGEHALDLSIRSDGTLLLRTHATLRRLPAGEASKAREYATRDSLIMSDGTLQPARAR
jgi:hypothetical protein